MQGWDATLRDSWRLCLCVFYGYSCVIPENIKCGNYCNKYDSDAETFGNFMDFDRPPGTSICKLVYISGPRKNHIQYSQEMLLTVWDHLWDHLSKHSRRKRGSRGGIHNWIRRRGRKLPLPAITLSNVWSLHNKMNKLSALIKFNSDFCQTGLFCFTETWLSEDIADVDLAGFHIMRW